MRLTRVNDRACIEVDGLSYDIHHLTGGGLPSDLDDLVRGQHLPALRSIARDLDLAEALVVNGRLGPPIRTPGTIFGWGLNFSDHTNESGFTHDEFPTIFVKFPGAVTGPHDSIVLPADDAKVDYEAELAVVVGKPGRDIPLADALEHVAGVMCAQDVSERHVQLNAGTQFCLGKGFDSFCPWGPALVTLDEFDDLAALEISCHVNDELVQQASLGDMIVNAPAMISELSRFTTLRAGDVILGGSPAGVGLLRHPPRFLSVGDVVRTHITKIGNLRNTVVAPC